MKKNKSVIVIQNTHYHFETALSIYQSLVSAGYDTYFYKCDKDVFEQESFLKKINVNFANEEIIKNSICGFVVSALSSPFVDIRDPIPNSNDSIFEKLKDRLVYISHRFKNESDYIQNKKLINKENSICLSPIAENIGLDYFNPIEIPIKEKHLKIDETYNLTIQSHFHLKVRDFELILKPLRSFNFKKYSFKINILGDNTNNILSKFKRSFLFKNVNILDGLNEENFYNVINSYTHFLICLIDDKINNQTYLKERYSSNFNHALALNKPVLCHECFKDIYNIPGVYYNDNNFISKFEEVLNLNEDNYNNLLKKFDIIKKEKRQHNNKVLNKKILLFN